MDRYAKISQPRVKKKNQTKKVASTSSAGISAARAEIK
jgi:hypothetical protein